VTQLSYEIAWDLVASSIPALLKGAVGTLELTALSVSIGLVVGISGAAARVGAIPALRSLTRAYVEIIRNTPMLVQLYFVYYGLPRLGLRLDSDLTALIALSLYCGAYVVEIIRAGIEAVPRGQVDAARALGLSEFSVFSRVVLPQALRTSFPALGGQVIVMLKISSLASVIGAVELTYFAIDLVAQTYRAFEFYALVGLIYLCLTLAVGAINRRIESRLRTPS